MRDPMQWIRYAKSYWTLDRPLFPIWPVLQAWLLRTTTCTVLFPIIYSRENSTMRMISKWICSTSSTKSLQTSMSLLESSLYQSVVDKSEIVMKHTLLKDQYILVFKKRKFLKHGKCLTEPNRYEKNICQIMKNVLVLANNNFLHHWVVNETARSFFFIPMMS